MPIANFGVNYGLLNKEQLKNRQTENTNLAEVKDQMLKEYKKEETDNLLNKLENIGYLFDQ